MARQTRRKFSPAFKAKVALEAIKNEQTLSELGRKFEVQPVVISKWKKEFLENMGSVFEKKNTTSKNKSEVNPEKLYAQIGQLKVENDFLKKSCERLGILDHE